MAFVKYCLAIVLMAAPSLGLAQPCTVLLHGLLRDSGSMFELAEELELAGHYVVNMDYASRHHPIEHLAETVVSEAINACASVTTEDINFVTHSLGGILVRQYFSEHDAGIVARVVMLGPPNQGSQVTDKLKDLWGYEWLNGPAGMQLGTEGLVTQLGAVDFELGIIAGTRSINLFLSSLLPNSDDGKVSVENTRVDGMCGFLVLPVTHTFMMKDVRVIKETLHFIKQGHFQDLQVLSGCHVADIQL